MNKSTSTPRCKSLISGLLVLVMMLLTSVVNAVEIPSYDVQYIGGFPKAVNNHGQAVGWISVGGAQRAWVSTPNGYDLLPVQEGWHSQANDINDSGVIVGSAGGGIGVPDRAVTWTPNGPGYDLSFINTGESDSGAAGLAINNLGAIVGSRSFLDEIRTGVFTTVTRGFLVDEHGVYTPDLSALGFNALPSDINDNGQIVGGSVRLTNGVVEDLGLPDGNPTRYALAYLNAINNVGQVGASTVLATSSSVRTASRYTDGSGWKVLSYQGSYDAAYGINDNGDVTFEASYLCANGAASPMVYLDGIGTFCVQDLLTDSSWIAASAVFDNDINNNGEILVAAYNHALGLNGAVLLKPAGPIQPPASPQNLTATVHEADAQQPWNSIDLAWTGNIAFAKTIRVERSLFGANAWQVLATLESYATSYRDLNIEAGETYEYQVIAVGLAGESAPASVIATAPGTTVDTEAPVVTFTSPSAGDNLSGNVQITLNATDNVGVTSVRIETTVNSNRVIICDVSNPSSSTVSCSWNTRKVPYGSYTLNATASDDLGNFSRASTSFNLIESKKGGGGGGGKCNPKKGC